MCHSYLVALSSEEQNQIISRQKETKTSTGTYVIFFSAMGPELEPKHFLLAAESLFNTKCHRRLDKDARLKVYSIYTQSNARVVHWYKQDIFTCYGIPFSGMYPHAHIPHVLS